MIMSPNKTLYIRDEDLPIWERAEEIAREHGVSLSQHVTQALKRTAPPIIDEEDLEEIRVTIGEHNRAEAFAGRWLVEPDRDETRTGEEGYDAGAYWGVALTKRGSIAVYTAHCNEGWPATLEVFGSLDATELPEDIKADASAALGQEHVIWRDI
jgi:hypothetical protein